MALERAARESLPIIVYALALLCVAIGVFPVAAVGLESRPEDVATIGTNWTFNCTLSCVPTSCKLKAPSGWTGNLSDELGLLSCRDNVTSFDVADSNCSGTLPNSLGTLTSLSALLASRNRLSGTLPASLSRLRAVTKIDLDNNRLTGSLPPELGQLRGLKELKLKSNKLSGPLPEALGNITSVTVLDFEENLLTGSLPAWPKLIALQTIDVELNRLNGTLPNAWGNLSSLRKIDVERNAFTGTLPDSWGNLTQLSNLDVFGNMLTGTIPARLGDLKSDQLRISSNFLTGTIPRAVLQNVQYMAARWTLQPQSCPADKVRSGFTSTSLGGCEERPVPSFKAFSGATELVVSAVKGNDAMSQRKAESTIFLFAYNTSGAGGIQDEWVTNGLAAGISLACSDRRPEPCKISSNCSSVVLVADCAKINERQFNMGLVGFSAHFAQLRLSADPEGLPEGRYNFSLILPTPNSQNPDRLDVALPGILHVHADASASRSALEMEIDCRGVLGCSNGTLASIVTVGAQLIFRLDLRDINGYPLHRDGEVVSVILHQADAAYRRSMRAEFDKPTGRYEAALRFDEHLVRILPFSRFMQLSARACSAAGRTAPTNSVRRLVVLTSTCRSSPFTLPNRSDPLFQTCPTRRVFLPCARRTTH